MDTRVIFGVLLTVLAALNAGCATLHTQATIPTGSWTGDGVFVAAGPSPDAKGHVTTRPWIREQGRYPTDLTIRAVQIDDQDGYEIEILSPRGRTEHLEGDRTHLIVRLVPAHRLRDGLIQTYRVTDFGVAFHEEPPKLDSGPHGEAHASCMLEGGVLVLQMHYLEGFNDTLRFAGNTVTKDGTYAGNEGDGFIHWTERLRRQ